MVRDYLYNLFAGKTKGLFGVILIGLLFPFSLAYGLAVVILSRVRRSRPLRFRAKVISVGNITLGGTGKTSFVEYLAEKLNLSGAKIAILSRGYKRDYSAGREQALGDEPAMLKNKLPFARVVVDKNRLRAASRAIGEFSSDTLILDDGMQQWKIFKDMEIVMLDSLRPFANRCLLPAGFLREPLFSLKRADVFVLNQGSPGNCDPALIGELNKINPGALILKSVYEVSGISNLSCPGRIIGPENFKSKNALLFCGIGNPEAFKNSVELSGIRARHLIKFDDHHAYTQKEIARIIHDAQKAGLDLIITTEKDAVKIRSFYTGDDIMVLSVRLKIIHNEEEFDRRLSGLHTV